MIRFALSILFLFGALSSDSAQGAKLFGAPVAERQPLPISEVIAKFDKYKPKKDLIVSGTVDKVCKKKGCWMVVKDKYTEVRVTFKDYGFFVPQALVGKKITAQGKIARTEQSVDELKHLLRDEGKSEAEVNKIKQPKVAYQFVASGVLVQN